jgi:fused signal recognition particle receptor
MFGFGKKNAPDKVSDDSAQATPDSKPGFFGRLKAGLTKTRSGLSEGIARLVVGRKQIDDELLEDLETQLLTADVGVEATLSIVADLTRRVERKQLQDADALLAALREDMRNMLEPVNRPLAIPRSDTPFVLLMVGINGAGKTTTIGKIARRLQDEGRSVMLAAGDTFRAAAVEQLQKWGERNQVPVIAQQQGADSASVIFDALQAAQARQVDVLIADTAGRLHTQSNLMEELKKIKRVLGKLDAGAPHEVMLVVDAGTGQNALNQARQFSAAVAVTGITLTKLDGTARGGIIFAIAKQLGIPIRFVGVGEAIEDLRPFNAGEFVDALFDSHDVTEP